MNWTLALLLCQGVASTHAGCLSKPHHDDFAGIARWLTHCNDWGVMSTHSVDLDGVAFRYGVACTAHMHAIYSNSNVVSFSDGPAHNSTGRILLYMADMDSTVVDLKVNASATFTVTEAQLPGGCPGRDVEDPTCAKVVLIGTLSQVEDVDRAKEMVFARHPHMRTWHAHAYHVYELSVQRIRVLSYFGGYGWPSVQDYFDSQVFATL